MSNPIRKILLLASLLLFSCQSENKNDGLQQEAAEQKQRIPKVLTQDQVTAMVKELTYKDFKVNVKRSEVRKTRGGTALAGQGRKITDLERKNLCVQDEIEFMQIRNNLIIELKNKMLSRKDLNAFSKTTFSGFPATKKDLALEDIKSNITQMRWESKSSGDIKALQSYLSTFENIEHVELNVKKYQILSDNRSDDWKGQKYSLMTSLDVRGLDKQGFRRHDTGKLDILVSKTNGLWKMDQVKVNKGESLTKRSPAFREVTKVAGIGNLPSYERMEAIRRGGYAMSVGDYNNDGYKDLYVGHYGPGQLLKGNKSGHFTLDKDSGIANHNYVKSASFTDFDNDGDSDLLIIRFTAIGPEEGAKYGEKYVHLEDKGKVLRRDIHLYENKKGKFHKVEASFLNIDNITDYAMPLAVGDFNKDGLVDFYVGFPGVKDFTTLGPARAGNKIKVQGIYLNRGNLKFEVAPMNQKTSLNYAENLYPHSALVADINQDSHQDIIVVDDRGNISPVYQNDGSGKFTQSNDKLKIKNKGYGMGFALGDLNNDHLVDIAFTNVNFHASERMSESCMANWQYDILPRQQDRAKMKLYSRTKSGEFLDKTSLISGQDLGEGLAGVEFIDYDNDGLQDIYVSNGLWTGTDEKQDISSFFVLKKAHKQYYGVLGELAGATQSRTMNILRQFRGDIWSGEYQKDSSTTPSLGGFQRNRLLKNNGDGTYTDVAYLEGIDSLADGYIVTQSDLNGDGKMDIILRNCDIGTKFNHFNPVQVFMNENKTNNNSIAITLEGVNSSRDAIGASLYLRAGRASAHRQLLSNNGSAQSEKIIIFGLGEIEKAEELVINWPSGTTQVLKDVKPGRYHIKEGNKPAIASK
jgi:hypothetical protein